MSHFFLKKCRLIFILTCLLSLSTGFKSFALTNEISFFDICATGSPEQIIKAIDSGSSVDDRDDENFTPIMAAAISNTPEAVNTLILAGANVNTADISGLTPLMYAAGNNMNQLVCNALISAGANVNVRDNAGYTALMYAAMNNRNPKVTEILVKYGSSLTAKNNNGETAIIIAIKNSNTTAEGVLKKHMKKFQKKLIDIIEFLSIHKQKYICSSVYV